MKHIIFTTAFLMAFASLSAQQWVTSTNTVDIYNANTGNVGIGTTSPQAKLHLNGNFRLDGNEIFFSDNGQIRSLDSNHRILFRRSENIMQLREYGRII